MRSKNLFLRTIITAIFVGSALFLLNGCGREEMQRVKSENDTLKNKNETLKNENEKLKGQIASLGQEIAKLKETAEFHYQQGVDLLKDKKYEEAKAAFNTVIEKYPESLLISSAKENLKQISREIRKVEAEKLAAEEKSPAEAQSEWLRLRGNENAYKGKIVTWKCVYYDVDLGRRGGWNFGAVSKFRLKDDLQKVVHVDGGCHIYPEPGRQEGSIDAWRTVRKINEGDLFQITGKFLGVEEFGYHTGIYIKPIKMKKIGFAE